MMRPFLRVTFWLWLALAPAMVVGSSHQPTFIQLFPQAKWQLTDVQPLSLGEISRWGGIPAVEAEYGVKSAELRTYALGGTKVQAVIEEASDPSAAFGLLTFYQTTAMKPEPGMRLAVFGPDMALMARGNVLVRVPDQPVKNVSEADVRSFLLSIGGAKPSDRSMELLPAELPADGMIPGSEKYALGPEAAGRAFSSFRIGLLGFSDGAEVHGAEYKRSKGNLRLMVVNYPTPQIARNRFGAMQDFLSINRGIGTNRIYGKRDGSYVFLVQAGGSTSPAQATVLLNELSVTKYVSLDQKYPGKPIGMQLFELIMGNVLLILILVGMAVAAGVLMVIARYLLAKWFPAAWWAHPGEDSFIQLHLEGR